MPRSSRLALFVALSGALLLLSACSDSSSPPVSQTVTLHVFDTSFRPVATSAEWAAFQDGDKAWVVLAPSATGVYTATVTDAKGRYGFALVADGDLHLQHGTAAEDASPVCFLDTGITLARKDAADKRAYHAIHGSIGYDFTPGDSMVEMLRSRSASTPISTYSFTVPDGLRDLVVSDNTWSSPRLMNWLYLERGLDVQADVTHNVTVAAAQRVMLEDGATLQVTGDATNASVSIGLVTANGTWAMLAHYNVITGNTAPFRSVPAAALISGDLYEAELICDRWQKTACFASPAGMTIGMPVGAFATFAASAVDAGGSRYPVIGGLSMAGGRGYLAYCSGGTYFVDFVVSTGWLRANEATSCQVPDLTGLAGWQAAWSIPAATTLSDADAVFLDGNVTLAKCVRRYFSEDTAPLGAGEWVGFCWKN